MHGCPYHYDNFEVNTFNISRFVLQGHCGLITIQILSHVLSVVINSKKTNMICNDMDMEIFGALLLIQTYLSQCEHWCLLACVCVIILTFCAWHTLCSYCFGVF